MNTRIKICGITCLEDALVAASAGADALGFVFYEPSPRAVSAEQAAEVISSLPPFVSSVGLFVNADELTVHRVLATVSLDLLQFHGDEDEQFCSQFNRPYMKAVRVKDEQDILNAQQQFPTAKALLLDAYVDGVPGGTGECFDWACIPKATQQAFVLAGGLTPLNVVDAIKQVKPWAVDVSGGVELKGHKGRKDPERIQGFIEGVRSV